MRPIGTSPRCHGARQPTPAKWHVSGALGVSPISASWRCLSPHSLRHFCPVRGPWPSEGCSPDHGSTPGSWQTRAVLLTRLWRGRSFPPTDSAPRTGTVLATKGPVDPAHCTRPVMANALGSFDLSAALPPADRLSAVWVGTRPTLTQCAHCLQSAPFQAHTDRMKQSSPTPLKKLACRSLVVH